MSDILQGFRQPSGDYRPAPLWVWNDDMTEEQIDFQLGELASHGFGGAFLHPRPGMVTEYLSEDWFRLWGYALEKAKSLGLNLSIYDENSYPSGFAGGHVSARCPEALLTVMRCQQVADPAAVTGERLAVYALTADGDRTQAENLADVHPTQWAQRGDSFLVITREQSGPTGWLAGFAYVDILRPQVTQAFLETTHEQYARRFGTDFGGSIPALFTDEPSIGEWGGGKLPFSFWLAQEFKKRNGYDLMNNLPCVFRNVEGDCFDRPAEKVRFDYFDTVRALWMHNSVEVISRWCEEHGVNWTGHYMEHLWPLFVHEIAPATQSVYEYHQWPAVDMLMSHYLRAEPTHSVVHTLRELRSAVNQFGKERAVCELYGAGGWDSTFEDYKRMADWVLVNGVNFICQHLVYSTLMGARKHDHPQSFDWRQSWWEEYTALNDYVGRASYLLAQGRMEQRILVLNPTLTGYLTENHKASGDMLNIAGTDCIREPDMREFLELCQQLTRQQWDYDLGDEYTLARHGAAENGRLRVAEQNYACVLVSGSMKNMLSSTAELLKACAVAGVPVIVLGEAGPYVEGLKAPDTYAALARCWERVSPEALDTRLEALLPRRLTADTSFPLGFDHMRRQLPGGETLWFFVNHAMETYTGKLTLPGGSVRQLELFTGEVRDLTCSTVEGYVTVPMELVRNQSLMLLVSPVPVAVRPTEAVRATRPMALTLQGITREQENILPISYASYNGGEPCYVKHLCNRIFRERGFADNPWDGKVQFRRNILDREEDYGPESGFTVTYRFEMVDGFIPSTLSVVAEHPEYCRLRVNGTDVLWNPGETYLDHHFGVADIAGCAVAGENTVEVIVDVFHVLMEVDTVYVKGDFSVIQQDGRWVLAPAQELGYGAWKQQGLAFYPYATVYRYAAMLDKVPCTALLDAADYQAAAVSVTVNGQLAGLLHLDGKRGMDIASLLQAGENEITLRVCGNMKNLLGPHFFAARGSAWPAMWRGSPAQQPRAEQYDLLDMGLNEAPTLTVSEE